MKSNVFGSLVAVLLLFSSVVEADSHLNDQIYSGLSESLHFRVYPYVDKAYRLEAAGQFSDALSELRHAMVLVPDHVPFMKFAYQLAVKAGIHDGDLEAYIDQLPESERGELLLELRARRSLNAELFTPYQFYTLSQGLTEPQVKRWYLIHLYAIESKRGKKAALHWSDSQPRRYKSTEVYRYEAYQWFKQKQYQKSLPLLERIQSNQESTLEDDKTYLLSLLYLGREKDAQAFVKQKDNDQLTALLLKNQAESQINTRRLAQAKVSLEALEKTSQLTGDEEKQLEYIRSLSTEQMDLIRRKGMLFPACLQQVLALDKSGDHQAALQQMSHCDPMDSPEAWLNVAQQVSSYSLLEGAHFERREYETTRRKLLVDHYIEKSDWQAVVALLKDAQNTSEMAALATAYGHQGEYLLAAEQWQYLYQHSERLKHLDLATYNAALAKDEALEGKLYHDAIESHPEEFAQNLALVQRAQTLAYRDISALHVSDIEYLADVGSKQSEYPIAPSIWFEQQQCSKLDTHVRSDFAAQALAYCQSAKQPIKAAHTYLGTLSDQVSAQDALVVARWLHQGQDFQGAKTYWLIAEKSVMTPFDQLDYVETLLKAGDVSQANAEWLTLADSESLAWWELGVAIANKMDDGAVARARTEQAIKQVGSAELARCLALTYSESDDVRGLKTIEQTVIEHDQQGGMSAAVGYALAKSYPEISKPLFANAVKFAPYSHDASVLAEYASAAIRNGDKSQGKDIYQQAIQEPKISDEQREYFQAAHRDLNLGWKFAVAGWIGESRGSAVPGYSDQTGDFFLYEDAKYYFDTENSLETAFSISGLHSGQYDSDNDNWTSSELDIGVQIKPLQEWSYFLKLGVKQGLNSDNDDTKPYLRLSADVFSNDDWSKAWKADKDNWLTQQLYVDALYDLDGSDEYSLYSRYDVGRTFKVAAENRQRVTPYVFAQWGQSETNHSKFEDTRAGAGVSFAWEWKDSNYDGYAVSSEVGLEWQHIIDNTGYQDSGDTLILRFSSYF
ncbi:NfrA family protein [Vibrio coralliilyticus]